MSGAHLGIERLNAAVGHVSLRCVPRIESEIGFCIRLVRLHNVRTAHTDNREDLSESVAIPDGDRVDMQSNVDMQSTWTCKARRHVKHVGRNLLLRYSCYDSFAALIDLVRNGRPNFKDRLERLAERLSGCEDL